MSAGERFERMAECFERECGYLAPGKSEGPAAYAGEVHERMRHLLWRAFVAGVQYGIEEARR